MATEISEGQLLRFKIDPQPGESLRACTAIAHSAMSTTRGNAIVLGLSAAVALASYFLTPATWPTTLVIGLGAVLATVYALQAVGRAQLRRMQAADPHALETHFIELSPDGVRAWCAHVDARYPWQDFAKATENSEFYLFVRSNGTGSAIPKRLLDEAADAALRDRIREWSPDHGAALARDLAR